jgi:hypothetical protein
LSSNRSREMQNACSLKRWHVMEWGAGSPLTGGAWASAKHRALKSLPTCNRTLPEHVSQIFYPPLLSSAGARPPPCCPCRRGRRAAPGGARGPGRAAQHRATQHARWRACPALLAYPKPAAAAAPRPQPARPWAPGRSKLRAPGLRARCAARRRYKRLSARLRPLSAPLAFFTAGWPASAPAPPPPPPPTASASCAFTALAPPAAVSGIGLRSAHAVTSHVAHSGSCSCRTAADEPSCMRWESGAADARPRRARHAQAAFAPAQQCGALLQRSGSLTA